MKFSYTFNVLTGNRGNDSSTSKKTRNPQKMLMIFAFATISIFVGFLITCCVILLTKCHSILPDELQLICISKSNDHLLLQTLKLLVMIGLNIYVFITLVITCILYTGITISPLWIVPIYLNTSR